jgi:hypothetical protein
MEWLLSAFAFAAVFSGCNSQQTISVSHLAQPSAANYDYANNDKKFITTAIASLTGFSDFGSSFSASDAGWCAGATAMGLSSVPLQFPLALASYPANLVNPIWVFQTWNAEGTQIIPYRVSCLASGSTFCVFTDKIGSFRCKILAPTQNPPFVDVPFTITAASFPSSASSNFALVDLAASDAGNTFALTFFADMTNSGSSAQTLFFRFEQDEFLPVGGPYTWNDITPSNLPPAQFNTERQRLALGYGGTVFATGHPSASAGSGVVMIYSILNVSNFVLSSEITGNAGSSFGFSLAIKDSILAVGAPGGGSTKGAVFVFRIFSNGTVLPVCSIIDSVASSKFGHSIFIEMDSLRSPFVFHVMVTAPAMVLRPDQSFKYVTVAAIRVDLRSNACSISGSIQWPTVVVSGLDPPPADTDTLTGVFASSGQVVTFVKRSGSIANSVLQSVFCLPNFRRASRTAGSLNQNVYFCQACELGTYSWGGISSTCDICPLPDPKSIVVWGYGCQFSCPLGSYIPSTCVFDCDVTYSRVNNSEWLPLPAPTCSLRCSLGFFNASGTCEACPALVNHSMFTTPGLCSSNCLETFFWADGSQVASRINSLAVMCVNCSEQNRLLGNAPPAHAFWQDNSTICAFTCDLGYFKSDAQCDPCQSKPLQSAWILDPQCNFICNFGYFGSNCRLCSELKFASGITSPANSHWVDGAGTCDWACNSGYDSFIISVLIL